MFLAYLLWLIGGLFGLHLIYLRRYRHTLVVWLTFGFFGLDVFRHLIKIGDYVAESNLSNEYVDKLKAIQRHRSSPRFSILRFSAEIVFSYFLQVLLFSIFPIEVYELDNSYHSVLRVVAAWILVPFGIALGTVISFLLSFIIS